MSRRSGSRWENRDYGNQRKNRPVQPPTVSDEDAMKALLFSAERHAKEREREDARKDSYRGRYRRDGDNSAGRSSRWGDKGRPSKNTDEDVSYYGPGRMANSSSNSTNNDRKRKLPPERERERQMREPSRVGGSRNRRETSHHRVEDDEYDGKSKKNDDGKTEEGENSPPQFKPNFGLSGALAEDTESGNVYKGVVLKFKEPPEARAPNTQWRFYVFKPTAKGSSKKDDDNDLIETLHISKQSAYLLGRNSDIADIPLLHPSLSSQHAVLQYRAVPVPSDKIGAPPRLSCQPYIMDLESTNGTFLNGVRIDAARYYQLKRGDVLTFGASTREYVLLTENTTSVA